MKLFAFNNIKNTQKLAFMSSSSSQSYKVISKLFSWFFLLTTVLDHMRSPIVYVLTFLSGKNLASSSDHIIVPPTYVFKTGTALFVVMEKNRLWHNYLFYANIQIKDC